MNDLSISASISVTIRDIWTKFGTDLKFHTAYTPEWSNSQPKNTRCRLPPFWIFRLCEIKNVSSSGLDEDICIKFYGIMHWTSSYTTACTVDHGLYGSAVVQAVLTVSTIVSCSNNFNTKLGSGCWATGAPQKWCGPRTPYAYHVLHTLNRVTLQL